MLGVGEQRDGEPVLGGEALVRVDRLRRDAEHLGVEVVEVVGGVAVGAELPRADRGEVARVEGEDDPAARGGRRAGRSAPPVPASSKSGALIADLDLRHRTELARSLPGSIVTSSMVTACVGCSVAGSPSSPIASTTSIPSADLAEHRVVGRQAGVGGRGDDEELAARGARRLDRRLRHRDQPRACTTVSCGGGSRPSSPGPPAARVPGRVAALDHEARGDAVEDGVVVEALLGEEGERVRRLRRVARCRARSEAAAARLDDGGRRLAALEHLLGLRRTLRSWPAAPRPRRTRRRRGRAWSPLRRRRRRRRPASGESRARRARQGGGAAAQARAARRTAADEASALDRWRRWQAPSAHRSPPRASGCSAAR